jgi:multidrug efflux pump subunit AcrA (membrane-fusion protein)
MKLIILFVLFASFCFTVVARASECGPEHLKRGRAVVRNVDNGFLALSDGQVSESPFAAGDVVPAGHPLLSIASIEAQNRIVDIQGRVAELYLKLLDLRNVSIVNQAGLADYQRFHGPVSREAIRHATRQDEIDILERTIADLRENAKAVVAMQRHAGGVFPYPLLLLSDPPRVSETVKAGTPLFTYSVLDRLAVVIFGKTDESPPEHAYMGLGGQCIRLDYLRAVQASQSNAVEWQYQTRVDRRLTNAMAKLLRSPRAFVGVFF